MQTNNRKDSKKSVGRKPKKDPAIHRYVVRLTSEENGHFDIQFQKSGFKERSKFLKALIFEREIKVVKLDKAARHMTLAMFYGYTFDEHGVDDKKNKSSRQEMLYSKFIDLLSWNFRKEREVKFYADKLCVTPKYLSQVVSGLTGRTPSDYIEELVVMESKALLNSTPMTIQQVSDELHFPSQSFFGKYFKRIVGMSPKEYRKSTKD